MIDIKYSDQGLTSLRQRYGIYAGSQMMLKCRRNVRQKQQLSCTARRHLVTQNAMDDKDQLSSPYYHIKNQIASILMGCTVFSAIPTVATISQLVAPQASLAFVSDQNLDPEEQKTVKLFSDSTPSVVNITNIQTQTDYYTLDTYQMPVGTGSGMLWDKQAHVVTNFHVVRGASSVKVTLFNQQTYTAKVVGAEPDKDVAVLKLEIPDSDVGILSPVALGTSDSLRVGQKVFAIGNPFGLDHTLTQGIISGLGRQLTTGTYAPLKDVIQTDAAINPGNSGGVLLNSSGKLIGMNTAIADPTGKGSSSGVGFAIPIDTIKSLVDQILKFGRVIRPYLGVTLAPPQTLQQIKKQGVLILDIGSESPAGAAGLIGTTRDGYKATQLGDIIVKVDGQDVKTPTDLFNVLDECKVGQTVSVTVQRQVNRGDFKNFREVTVDVLLKERQLARTD